MPSPVLSIQTFYPVSNRRIPLCDRMPKRSPRTLRTEAYTAPSMDRIAANLRALLPPGAVDAAVLETGMNRSTIYKWMNAEQTPNVVDLAILANFLGVSLTQLVSDQPLPRAPSLFDASPVYQQLIHAIHALAPPDRTEVIRHAMWSASRARPTIEDTSTAVASPSNVAVMDRTLPQWTEAFPVSPDDFNENGSTDYPRPFHGWEDEEEAGESGGVKKDMPRWLNSREVRKLDKMTVRVRDDRVSPYREGWKLLVDVTRQDPSLIDDGEIAVAYSDRRGTFVGVVSHARGQTLLSTDDGENITIGDGGFSLLGPVEDAWVPKQKRRKRGG